MDPSGNESYKNSRINHKINDLLFMVVERLTVMERYCNIDKYHRDGIDT